MMFILALFEIWVIISIIDFFIYNPYTNYCDDVVAVVDNYKIR